MIQMNIFISDILDPWPNREHSQMVTIHLHIFDLKLFMESIVVLKLKYANVP